MTEPTAALARGRSTMWRLVLLSVDADVAFGTDPEIAGKHPTWAARMTMPHPVWVDLGRPTLLSVDAQTLWPTFPEEDHGD